MTAVHQHRLLPHAAALQLLAFVFLSKSELVSPLQLLVAQHLRHRAVALLQPLFRHVVALQLRLPLQLQLLLQAAAADQL